MLNNTSLTAYLRDLDVFIAELLEKEITLSNDRDKLLADNKGSLVDNENFNENFVKVLEQIIYTRAQSKTLSNVHHDLSKVLANIKDSI